VLADYSFRALSQFGRGSRVQLDAQRLPFRDRSVDAFFSIAAIEHVPQPERVLEEVDRCLAPGGRALLFPAWLVFPWASRDLARLPYRALCLADKLRKAAIPLRRRPAYRFAAVLPSRLLREAKLARGRALPFAYRRLSPTFERYLTSDSDAFTSMDPHACAAFFASRGYDVRGAATVRERVFLRYVPVEVRKPADPRA
jgi:ubiquinone/menaquinone biosynthesis C-methylase UbiE